MADTKISGLSAVTDVQDTDEFVLARSGTTKKIDGVDLRAGVAVGSAGILWLPAPPKSPGTYGLVVVQGTWDFFEDTSQPIYHCYIHNGTSTAQNDELTMDVALAAGTWRIDLYVVKNTNCGIVTFRIDGSSVGTADTYNGGGAQYDQVVSVTGVTVATTGLKTLSLKMATKNASSSNYRLNLTVIRMTRTGA